MILRYFALIGIILLTYSCSSNEPADEKETITVIAPTVEKSIPIDSFESFIDLSNKGILQVHGMKPLTEGKLAIYHSAYNTWAILNKQWSLLFQFGNKGRGPGEWLQPGILVETDKHFLISDTSLFRINTFNKKGEFLYAYPYEQKYPWGNICVLRDSVYVVPSGGMNNSLLVKKDMTTKSTTHFGIPKHDFIREKTQSDRERAISELINGKIPSIKKNAVILRSNDKYIYAWLKLYSELRKYDFDGRLLWERKLNLPANKALFNDAMQNSKKRNRLGSIEYILNFQVFDGEIFMLTMGTSEITGLLVRLDKNGNLINSYYFPTARESRPPTIVLSMLFDASSNTFYFQFLGSTIINKTTL